MLSYDIDSKIEAFSTNVDDNLDFPVVLPLHQAHGIRSAIVGNNHYDDLNGVDAIITNQPGLRIGVKTADCVPILVFDPSSSTIAAIHSGWKGTLNNIIDATLHRMAKECSCDTLSMIAVIAPCIHLEAFEVGDDLYELFAEKGYERFCQLMPRFGCKDHIKWHIDLPSICQAQLIKNGLSRIIVRPECTFTLHERFYSARRLGPTFASQRIFNCIKIK